MRETLEAFQPPASARGIAIDARMGENTLLATFDHRILQVPANIVSNAIKFTEPGR